MARFVSYRCASCGGTFKWLHHPSDSPPPEACQLCGVPSDPDLPPEPVFVPQAPGIRKSPYARSVDEVYRREEAASIERANEAASLLESEFARQPKDEFAGPILSEFQRDQVAKMRSELKVTNMRDPSEMRPGDTAAMTPSATEAAKNLSVLGSKPGFQVIDGARPAGAGNIDSMRQLLGPTHSQRAGAVLRAGNMGTFTGR